MFTYVDHSVRKNSGILLIDLMISIAIASLLIAFLLKVFLITQNNYHLQAALNHIQANAKTAIDILSEEVHKAGYIACPKLTQDFPIRSYQIYSITSQNKLTGTDTELLIRQAEYPNVVLNESMYDDSILYISNEMHFSAGDILIISDCKQAEIFQVAAISIYQKAQKIISTQPLHHRYTQYAEVSKVKINKFYVAKTGRMHTDGSHVYSLFMEDIKQRKIELVDDINYMRILYLLTSNNEVVEESAQEVKDWSRVIGAAIELEVVSPPLKKIWHMYATLG